MDAILHCKAEDLEDYYGLLGCDELSSSEQILAEYKVRAMECHPDKNPDNPQAVQDFQKLQEAKEVLTNENARNNYNLWRRSKITIPFRDWQALGDSVKASMHWAVKTKKEPMLKDRGDSPLLSPQDAVCQTEVPAAEMQFPETVNTPKGRDLAVGGHSKTMTQSIPQNPHRNGSLTTKSMFCNSHLSCRSFIQMKTYD
ncbi:dnaJ homolog subfamily C member 12 isoform X2 [Conger conger]|nr:dnaJ homolog subfamily C member 12 isoform X2 [Conger conger]